MKKLSRVLRSERGDLLVGSLVSVIIISIIMTASASFLVVAAKASITSSNTTAGTILLNSTLSDELPRAGSYTDTPVQLTIDRDGGSDAVVSIWREDTADGSFLHAATPRTGNADTCNTTDPDPAECLTSRVAVASGVPGAGYTKLDLLPGTDGAKYLIKVPADAAALQYVFKATAGEDSSTLTFSNGGATAEVQIPKDGSGYYYGTLVVEPGSTITVKSKGPATYDADTFTVYEAPND